MTRVREGSFDVEEGSGGFRFTCRGCGRSSGWRDTEVQADAWALTHIIGDEEVGVPAAA